MFKQLCVPESKWQLLSGTGKDADGGTNSTRNHNNVRSILKIAKNCVGPFRTKNADIWHSAPPWQCVSTLSCLHLNTARAFQLGAVWSLYWCLDLDPSDYHLLTYLKKWLGSQFFNNNLEIINGVKIWQSLQAPDFSDQTYKNLFPDKSVSILVVTTLRSILSMPIFFVNNVFLPLLIS
jgi:hypothetical protein